MASSQSVFKAIGLTSEAFDALARWYRKVHKAELYCVAPDGSILEGAANCRTRNTPACRLAHNQALHEAYRWGEPSVTTCPRNRLIWVVPLMINEHIIGAVIASVTERQAMEKAEPNGGPSLREAIRDLQAKIVQLNWTNQARLQTHQHDYQSEKQRAEAIHDYKATGGSDVRRLYLQDEPAMLSAIRRGDISSARGTLNRLLVHMMHQAGNNLEHTKSFFMELVVALYRTAIEAGGQPDAMMGDNFSRMAELSSIHTQEELAPWLHDILNDIMQCIHEHAAPRDASLADAMIYIRENCAEPITRDDAAKAAGLSGAHFSRLFHKQFGCTFTTALNRARVDHACKLLQRTSLSLVEIAQDAGFSDQSYFSKVFKQFTHKTPRQYRQRQLSS